MITTILTIPKEERETIEEVCAMTDIKVDFFTNEVNDQLLVVRFHESDPGTMFRLGKMIGITKIDKYISKL